MGLESKAGFMVFHCVKQGWAICAALLVAVATSVAVAADPPDPGLTAAIGVAADEAVEKARESDVNKLSTLKELATAQLRVGDSNGARRTLELARAIPSDGFLVSDIGVLSAKAGDLNDALEFIQKEAEESRARALGRVAVHLIGADKFADAARTIAILEALPAKYPQEATSSAPASKRANLALTYQIAWSEIGQAFARKGDIRQAVEVAGRLSDKGRRGSLLGEIARAQRRSGDQEAAAETVRRAMKDIAEQYPDNAMQRTRSEARTLARAGTSDDVRRIIEALPEKKSRDQLYSELADAYMQDGDLVRAREMAEASESPRTLYYLGGALRRAGDEAAARGIFMAAYDDLNKQKGMGRIDRMVEISGLVEGLISVGAFSQAVSLSKELDELNRPPRIVMAIKEETRRGDEQALRQTVPIALDMAKAPTRFSKTYLAELAGALLAAGYQGEARTVIGLAEQEAGRLSFWQRLDALKGIRAVQAEFGDKAGLEKTKQAIQREMAVFKDETERALSQGGEIARMAEALKLLQQREESVDPKVIEQKLKQAAELMGKNAGQQFISLMAIADRYSPQQETMDRLGDEIKQRDFVSAQKTAGSLKGMRRDMGLRSLARAQAEAQQFRAAFGTALEIADAQQRATVLTSILNAMPKAP
jgi:tetratricopeptide (TPR) repeat protein